MKRITLTLAVAGALVVPAMLLTGSAGAANPHGDKGDPSASCGHGNQAPCDDSQLPQSDGCLHGQAPAQNPHCQPGTSGITPSTPVASNPPAGTSPTQSAPANKPAQGVAGAQAGKQAGNPAAAVNSASTIEELPFTGLETLWLALIGGGMLALGLVLRRRSSSLSETLH
jgi:LPXTG-motif cell wall-anchored protein